MDLLMQTNPKERIASHCNQLRRLESRIRISSLAMKSVKTVFDWWNEFRSPKVAGSPTHPHIAIRFNRSQNSSSGTGM